MRLNKWGRRPIRYRMQSPRLKRRKPHDGTYRIPDSDEIFTSVDDAERALDQRVLTRAAIKENIA